MAKVVGNDIYLSEQEVRQAQFLSDQGVSWDEIIKGFLTKQGGVAFPFQVSFTPAANAVLIGVGVGITAGLFAVAFSNRRR